jgi:hypothetical protein
MVRCRRVSTLLVPALLAFSATAAAGLGLEIGAMAGLGQSLAYGSYLDARAAALAEYGAGSLGSPGRVMPEPFPGWGAGLYAEMYFAPWIGLRLEPRYAALSVAYLASTSAGTPYDRYGVYISAILVPLLVRGRMDLGPGRISASAGPFVGFPLGGITIVDRYASSSTTAAFPYSAVMPVFLGLSAGVGYEMRLGPGVVGLDLRADAAVTGVTSSWGPVGGGIMPVPVFLAMSYGFLLGGSP